MSGSSSAGRVLLGVDDVAASVIVMLGEAGPKLFDIACCL